MIKEIIVVEGRDDEVAVKRAVDCDTIATGGLYFKKDFIDELKKAHETRGIIILTDPDYAGGKIRKSILRKIPTAKNAYIHQKDAIKNGDIGIENASPESIREAIYKAKPENRERQIHFTMSDLANLGLTGIGSKEKRIALGRVFHFGYGNSKQFLNKLNAYNISREELIKELEEIDGQ